MFHSKMLQLKKIYFSIIFILIIATRITLVQLYQLIVNIVQVPTHTRKYTFSFYYFLLPVISCRVYNIEYKRNNSINSHSIHLYVCTEHNLSTSTSFVGAKRIQDCLTEFPKFIQVIYSCLENLHISRVAMVTFSEIIV